MVEEFRIIPNFPAYRISNFGNIQSRWQRRASYVGFLTEDVWKNLNSCPDEKGYPQVHLCDGINKSKTCRLHDLVMLVFIGPKPKGLVVRHLDSDPANNKLSNLVYGTYSENEDDKFLNGTWFSRFGGAKITYEQALEIRSKFLYGISQKELALEYNISTQSISRCINNKIWKEENK